VIAGNVRSCRRPTFDYIELRVLLEGFAGVGRPCTHDHLLLKPLQHLLICAQEYAPVDSVSAAIGYASVSYDLTNKNGDLIFRNQFE
jgi:hypothetical protein